MRWSFVVAVLFALLISPRTAGAQDDAQQLYEEALAAYEAEDWETAAEKFEAAYAIAPRPILVYNIAVAHGRNGDHSTALKYAELAALQGLESPQAEKNAARMLAWSATERALGFEPVVAEEVTPPQSVTAKRGWKIAGVGLLGLGAAAAAVTVVMELQLQDPVSDYESTTDAATANAILFDEIRPRQRVARIFSAVAIGAGVLGVAALIYGFVPKRDAQSALLVQPSGVGVRF